MVHTWLQQNGFDDLNRSKGFLIITYPLHEAVHLGMDPGVAGERVRSLSLSLNGM